MKKNFRKFSLILLLGFLFIGSNVYAEVAAEPGVGVDTIAPVITLKGESNITLNIGDTYTDAGATALDETDGDLTNSIITTSDVDISVAGDYTVTYDVSDDSGNAADEVIRYVSVIDPVASSENNSQTETLSISVSVDVPNTCTISDTDGVLHTYTATSSDQYLGICALEAALDAGDISNVGLSNEYPSMGLFVTSFNDLEADSNNQYWALYKNDTFSSSGLSSLPVSVGDVISFKLSDFSGNETGDFVNITIESLITDESSVAEETENIPSTNIHLDIETNDGELYNSNINVSACDSDNNPDTPNEITAYCAILQSGVSNDWSWYGNDAFLNSLGTYVNNDSNNGVYWGWFNNLELGSSALNKFTLNKDDKILLTYNTNPTKIEVSKKNPYVGESLIISAKGFGYDSSWNPTWTALNSGKISINGDLFDFDENGEYTLTPTDTTPIEFFAEEDSYLDSDTITVNPVESVSNNLSSGSSATSGSSVKQKTRTFSVPNALSFLESNQNKDSSFSSDMYTDWAAIAIASSGNSIGKKKIKNYFLSENFNSSVLTDYERRAMALIALGINPYSGTKIDYIRKIKDEFDGKQIGDNSLINDDVFGLVVLAHAGFNSSDDIIKNSIEFILSNQSNNGSWESPDLTAATIEALNNFSSVSGVSSAIDKGINYLVQLQNNNGSFGNIYSTAWVIQALSENSSLSQNINDAISYLTTEQQYDGGVSDDSDIYNRIWVTSYAIPAVKKLSWNDILENFDKQEEGNSSPQTVSEINDSSMSNTENTKNNQNTNTSNNTEENIASNNTTSLEDKQQKKVYTMYDFLPQVLAENKAQVEAEKNKFKSEISSTTTQNKINKTTTDNQIDPNSLAASSAGPVKSIIFTKFNIIIFTLFLIVGFFVLKFKI